MMKRMITKEYPYKTEEEKIIIYTFLNALYGYLYCSGCGNIHINRENKVIQTNLLLKEEQIQNHISRGECYGGYIIDNKTHYRS